MDGRTKVLNNVAPFDFGNEKEIMMALILLTIIHRSATA